MNAIKVFLKSRAAKYAIGALCAAVILIAAYFIQPGAKQYPSPAPSVSVSETAPQSDEPAPPSLSADITPAQIPPSAPPETSIPSPTAAATPTPTPKPSAAPKPSATPKPTAAPTEAPAAPTPEPTHTPTPEPPPTAEPLTCTISIQCKTILDNMEQLNPDKVSVVPESGWILGNTTVEFAEGESVFDVLKRVTREKRLQLEFVFTPVYNSAYIEGIHNIYEFDCGPLSGWMYKVNGRFPNYGCSLYYVKPGDTINWIYTCDLGRDIGGSNAVG